MFKSSPLRQLLRTALGIGAASLVASAAFAQAYPDKPIRLVVPYPAGGNSDVIARTIGVKLGEALGQVIVVDNKPGAAATIGTAEVARAKGDGYTLLLGDIATHAINKMAFPTLAYDPQKDFVPISRLTSVSLFLVASPKLGYKNVGDFIAAAKANPGKLSYASGGNGTPSHLAMEALRGATGIDLLHVPYKGSAPALNDIVGGQVDVMIDGAAANLIKGEKLNLLGVTGGRSPAFPNSPTLAESGVAGYEFSSWHGLFAPAGTPPAIVERISAELQKIAATEENKARFAALGITLTASSPKAFGDFITEQNRRLSDLVKARNIRFEQ